METEKQKVIGRYKLEIKDIHGNVRDSWYVNNIITNAGKAQLALLAGDASAVPFTYLAVGISSTAVSAGQTALQSEITDSGLARASATVSRTTVSVTNDTLQLVYTWTVSTAKTVEEIGIFNASSSGTMLSRVLTGTKMLAIGEQLTATYTVQFT